MSLFQCQHCGCCENTALASQGCNGYAETFFDWTGFEDRRGKKLCSACAPTKYSDGSPTAYGKWHGRFDRTFLPMGKFRTAKNGNLEHVDSGDQDFRKYAIEAPSESSGRDQRPVSAIEHLESKPCPECGATMLYDEGEPWEGPSWGCTGCGHSESARRESSAQGSGGEKV